MQPFDALTLKAVVSEAKPLIIDRKVEKLHQIGRDEVVLVLRSRSGICQLLLSAHAVYGRVCLVNLPPFEKRAKQPNFAVLLRKHLTGATLIGAEQATGERMLDLVFSTINEVGAASIKVLTAEIMGRHSNLILWDKESGRIIAASHAVTKEMSRQREIAIGLKYLRPPEQQKPNLFKLAAQEFEDAFAELKQDREGKPLDAHSLKTWLLNSFTGLGKSLADELVQAVSADAAGSEAAEPARLKDCLRNRMETVKVLDDYKPAMKEDLSRYTVLSWTDIENGWKSYPSVNDLVAGYYGARQEKERFQHLKERIASELKSRVDKLKARLEAADRHLVDKADVEDYKKFGDLILAYLNEIDAGETEHSFADLYEEGRTVKVALNPNLTPSQNAQHYYRKFAKIRAQKAAASRAKADAQRRLDAVQEKLHELEEAKTGEELEGLKSYAFPRPQLEPVRPKPQGKRGKHRLLSLISSDGWTIYMGRNRQENDHLITRLAKPQDIWMHVAGYGGAHVLIRVPSTGREPPRATLMEAAQLAARLSKASQSGKVGVIYTRCKNVRKLAGAKPGTVRYEREKTIEVDTKGPMPKVLKKLFSDKAGPPRRAKGGR